MGMKSLLSGVQALEVSEYKSKTSGKVFASLVVFEFGTGYPAVKKISLKDDQIGAARALVGQVVDIEIDLFIGKERTDLNFVRGKAAGKAAA